MANDVQITRLYLAPFGCRCNTSAWAIGTSFAATGSGSGWTVGADLGPTAYADNGVGLVRVTMADTSSLATGNRVYITGTTAAVYDGFWTVTVIDATHIDLVGSTYSVNPAAKGTLKEVSRYSFRVVGWLTPDELDTRNSFGLLLSLSPISGNSLDESNLYNLSPTLATNELYLSWTLPRGVHFHHISIYMQSDVNSTWSSTAPTVKVLPSSTNMTSLYGGALEGNIPGWATRTIISSPTAHTYLMQVPIVEKDLANNYIYINGALPHAFYDSTPTNTLSLLDSGADSGSTYSTASGNYVLDDSDGELTRILVNLNLTDATTGTLQFSNGAWTLGGVQVLTTLATINILEDTELAPRPLAELDYAGNTISVDNLNDCPIDGMTLTLPVTGISDPADLYRLHWAMQHRYPLAIVTRNDDGSIVYAKTWSGRILNINKTGGIRKNSSGPLVIQFLIDKQYNYYRDLKYYGIVSATSGTRALTLNGDLRRWIGEGTAIRIQNSTANDGQYAVESISYSYSGDISTVIVSTPLPDGTDDGYIQVMDW